MLVINESTLAQLTDWTSLTNQMITAMIAYENGDFVMPERVSMGFANNTLLLMPAQSGKYFSTKLVSMFPDNPLKNEPVIKGIVVLNNGETGEPVAVINGAKLTAIRTAAVSAAGIRYTTPEDVSSLGLIGAGVQGMHQILAACQVRPITKIYILDKYAERSKTFISCLQSSLPEVELIHVTTGEELVGQSEVIITATNSNRPVLPDDADLLRNKHIIALGSYKPQMRELPDSLFKLIDQCFVDVRFALEESGDIIHPIEMGLLKQKQVIPIGSLISGKVTADTHGTTLFKMVGMALFDLYTAQWFYEKAVRLDAGESVHF
ncbi:MAG: ornithine cyclodeaminase family protein [Bacteroidales bacterium]|jgi:ornithine cyclodeaminase